MENISKCIRIENLARLDVTAPVCLDRLGIFVISEGAFRISVDDKVYLLYAGDILVTKERSICRVKGKGNICGFGFVSEDDLLFGAFKTNSEAVSLLRHIAKEESAALYPLIELLFCLQEDFVELASLDERDAVLFARAVGIMTDNIEQRRQVEYLAHRLGISLSHIKRLFAEYAGMGAHDYYNLLKICRAKELLLAGETVTRTAEMTGFANQAYFSAAFKRITGISPKEFSPADGKRRYTAKMVSELSKQRYDLPDYLL